MSDHGAGPASNNTFFINKWLAVHGYLREKRAPLIDTALSQGFLYAKKNFSRILKRRIGQIAPRFKNRAHSALRKSSIDWDNTAAFSHENAPAIYINAKDKFPSGIIEPGNALDAVIDSLATDLYSLQCPITGKKIVSKVLRKNEIYHGRYLKYAPDLLFFWNDNNYTQRPSFSAKSENYIEKLTGSRLLQAETSSKPSGIHTMDGVFFASGPNIKRNNKVKYIHLFDVTATVLYLFNLSIPGDFDGRVTQEIFRETHLKKYPVKNTNREADFISASAKAYSDSENLEIEERLRGLGYID
jgi:predicted AlkP superfamily phosphohydrolase/phosphomutase